jgi:hypothetical protein
MDLTAIFALIPEEKTFHGRVSSANMTSAVPAIRRRIIRKNSILTMPILSSMLHMKIDFQSTKKAFVVTNAARFLNTAPGNA